MDRTWTWTIVDLLAKLILSEMRKGFEEDPVLEEKLLDWLITQGYS